MEFHYYIILPLLLWLVAKSKLWPLSLIVAAMALRVFLYHQDREIQSLAYWTIIGRIDQFALGMFFYEFRSRLANRHAIAVLTIIAFLVMYWCFDLEGGFFQHPSYPSPSPIWIVLPTIEGIAYAVFIAWYDNSFVHSTTGLSKFFGRIGEYSYSIYLLHFFVVSPETRFLKNYIMDISNFYVACTWAFVCFVLMTLPGYVSFRFIEEPFLRRRKSYVKAFRDGREVRFRNADQQRAYRTR